MHRLTNLARAAALGAMVAASACSTDRDVLAPALPAGDLFSSYVALGNSITAGFQSNGINDSTQRQSYARLLAIQMGTQYRYASLAGRGCPPPIANGVTGALSGTGSTPTTCDLRSSSSVTDVLNNVAVPGARVLDPTSASTVASNALTTFVLGGKTQVQRALDARPTFATIWIGNNDVLQAGATGVLTPTAGVSPGIVSTQAQFQTSYDLMLAQLLGSVPDLKGVLIGVVQVAGAPIVSRGAAIFASPAAYKAAINAVAGKPVVIDANCSGSTSLVNLPQLILQIRANTHPAVISCAKGTYPAPVGDFFVLDPAEQTQLSGVITAYNDYIRTKAAAIGFAFYDPNPLLAAQQAAGNIPPLPNFGSTTATYGPLISLDGVHPGAGAHRLIANDLITVINAKYGTSLTPVP